jgi:hypothetical protein
MLLSFLTFFCYIDLNELCETAKVFIIYVQTNAVKKGTGIHFILTVSKNFMLIVIRSYIEAKPKVIVSIQDERNHNNNTNW